MSMGECAEWQQKNNMQIQLKANKESHFPILNLVKGVLYVAMKWRGKINKPGMILIYVITWEWKEKSLSMESTEHENAST
jgi:hypothetical protein